MTLFVRLALAAVGGLFVFASNEPIGWFVAGIVGTALFFISLAPWDLGVPQKRRKKNEPVPFLQQMSTGPTVVQGMLLGFVHGLVTYLLLLPWIGEFVGSLPYVALSVVEALYSIALGAFGVLIARWRDWKVLLFPAMYVAVEYLRSSWPFDGFAWVRLAWGQINGPLANLAALGGVAFVTFSTVLAAVGVAMVIISKKRLAGAIITASVIAIGAVSSLYVDRNGTSDESIEVAAIQGNVPRMGLTSMRSAARCWRITHGKPSSWMNKWIW